MSETQPATPGPNGESPLSLPATSTTPTPTPTATSTTPTDTTPKPADASLLGDGKTPETKPAPAGAPEKYEAFKPPASWAEKGYELDPEVMAAAGGIFKEIGLTQDQAQKVIDLYTKTSEADVQKSMDSVRQQNDDWQKETKSDPEIGSKISNVVIPTISKALDSLQTAQMASAFPNAKMKDEFFAALSQTGAGNILAIIKPLYKMAQQITEGTHVAGGGPSKFGQQPNGRVAPPSAAGAMWPKLPSAAGS